MSSAPVSTTSAIAATDQLRDAILAGRFEPGQRLKESELARELNTSRTPVREALLALQAEGLVALAPNRGATVRPYEIEDLDEMYSLRALLEGYAAARAATRITPEQLTALEESLERIEHYDVRSELETSIAENLRFHGIILNAADSPRLAGLLQSVTQVPAIYRSYYWYTDELRALSQQFHGWLLKALRDGDVERAQRVATEHVLHARDVLVAHFSQADEA
jgi:DNA-binding GntR family transcriptional regulator